MEKDDKEFLNPSYYAIIPAEVRYSKEITANAKLLYGEITALCNKYGYCWASNNYFSKLYDCTPQAASRWINKLISLKFLKVVYVKNGLEIKQRKLYINEFRYQQKVKRVSIKSCEGINKKLKGYQQKVKENNTINTKDNNTINILQVSEKIEEIYKLYPTRCPISGRSTNKNQKNKEKIKSLLKEKTAEELINDIELFVNDIKKTNRYISDFSTFLNNIPDPETYETEPIVETPVKNTAKVPEWKRIQDEKEAWYQREHEAQRIFTENYLNQEREHARQVLAERKRHEEQLKKENKYIEPEKTDIIDDEQAKEERIELAKLQTKLEEKRKALLF